MAKSFSELQTLAIQIRDELNKKKNSAQRVGSALLDIIDNCIQNITDIKQKLSVFEHACSGFKRVSSEVQLPVTPSQEDLAKGFLVNTSLYLYVGTGGNAVNGRYFNVGDIRGPQGEPGSKGETGNTGPTGEKGEQGNSGVTGDTSDIVVINNLDGGESEEGSIKVLAAEQGKVLNKKFTELDIYKGKLSSKNGWISVSGNIATWKKDRYHAIIELNEGDKVKRAPQTDLALYTYLIADKNVYIDSNVDIEVVGTTEVTVTDKKYLYVFLGIDSPDERIPAYIYVNDINILEGIQRNIAENRKLIIENEKKILGIDNITSTIKNYSINDSVGSVKITDNELVIEDNENYYGFLLDVKEGDSFYIKSDNNNSGVYKQFSVKYSNGKAFSDNITNAGLYYKVPKGVEQIAVNVTKDKYSNFIFCKFKNNDGLKTDILSFFDITENVGYNFAFKKNINITPGYGEYENPIKLGYNSIIDTSVLDTENYNRTVFESPINTLIELNKCPYIINNKFQIGLKNLWKSYETKEIYLSSLLIDRNIFGKIYNAKYILNDDIEYQGSNYNRKTTISDLEVDTIIDNVKFRLNGYGHKITSLKQSIFSSCIIENTIFENCEFYFFNRTNETINVTIRNCRFIDTYISFIDNLGVPRGKTKLEFVNNECLLTDNFGFPGVIRVSHIVDSLINYNKYENKAIDKPTLKFITIDSSINSEIAYNIVNGGVTGILFLGQNTSIDTSCSTEEAYYNSLHSHIVKGNKIHDNIVYNCTEETISFDSGRIVQHRIEILSIVDEYTANIDVLQMGNVVDYLVVDISNDGYLQYANVLSFDNGVLQCDKKNFLVEGHVYIVTAGFINNLIYNNNTTGYSGITLYGSCYGNKCYGNKLNCDSIGFTGFFDDTKTPKTINPSLDNVLENNVILRYSNKVPYMAIISKGNDDDDIRINKKITARNKIINCTLFDNNLTGYITAGHLVPADFQLFII